MIDSRSQGVFGEAGSYRDEDSHPAAAGVLIRIPRNRVGILTHDLHRQRIGEDSPALQHLMNGSVHGRGTSGPAGLSQLHV
jgi:hypothetical protein